MILVVTGSRAYADRAKVFRVMDIVAGLTQCNPSVPGEEGTAMPGPDFKPRVGDCKTGADRFVQDWCLANWVNATTYRADWKTHGLAAGPIRNGLMIADEPKPDLCVGFIQPDAKNVGTRDCMAQARAAGVMVWEVT